MTGDITDAMERARRALTSARALFREGLVPECHAYIALALRTLLGAWTPSKALDQALASNAPAPAKQEPPAQTEKEAPAAPAQEAPAQPENEAPAQPEKEAPTAPAQLLPESPEPAAHGSPASTASEQLAFVALEKAGYRNLERLRSAVSSTSAVTAGAFPPALPLPADFEPIWAEVERLFRFTVRRLTPAPVRKRARLRLGIVVGAVVLIAAVFLLRLRTRPWVSTSGVFSANHPASQALDGMDGTEWLLPETTPGWIELTFRSSRKVRVVRLVNAHNQYIMDRASRQVRVTAYSDQGVIASAEGAFDKLTDERSVLDLTLNASGVTRLRVEVLTFFSRGGGLAEIELR